jgi:hypothetical protein
MRKGADPYLRKAAVVLAMAAVSMAVGCSSDSDTPPPPPDLSPPAASALILQKWSQDGPNHFKVTFHSDTLIACGVQNDLWKRVEAPYQGFTVVRYDLTEAGRKALFAIDLKESGRFHEVTLQGPYSVEVTGITPGSQPDMRQAAIRWDMDWDKAPAGVTACFPRFELTGTQTALFKLAGQQWTFDSFLNPDDAAAPPPATDTPMPSILHQ